MQKNTLCGRALLEGRFHKCINADRPRWQHRRRSLPTVATVTLAFSREKAYELLSIAQS